MRRVILIALAAGLLAACDAVPESHETRVARGQAVFAEHCASCHGPVGAGTAFGADLRSKIRTGFTYNRFSSVVMSGRTRITPGGETKVMPSFSNRSLVVENLEEIYFYLSEKALPSSGG